MARSGIRFYQDTLTPGLKSFPKKLDGAVSNLIDYYVPRVQSYARTNAPWTDRTGNARNGLRAFSEHIGDSHAVILTHSVPYGIWLEVRWEGRYAIITPTVKYMGREFMATARSLLRRMK